MRNIRIRLEKFSEAHLDQYKYWNHPSREFHKYNGPYYKKQSEDELNALVEKWRSEFQQGDSKVLQRWNAIVDAENDDLIGIVTWYWKSEETNWMEIGIVVFNENYWGHGIGYKALKVWITGIFNSNPDLARIGLSTWSGNERMVKLSRKLGMQEEARYRKARIVDDEYYDSVSYGILREEWCGGDLCQ